MEWNYHRAKGMKSRGAGMTNSAATGKVFLVGAGPGDPGLITLRGVQCLAQADVVLYDYLANARLLRHARPGAELVSLGAHGHTKIWKQAEINARMVADAQAGKRVVRLKGGDPAVFGRLGEELEALRAQHIAFEIVPGITAALAASSYAGVPITHRDLASAVALVTGHENDGKSESALDYDALARFPGTLVFYMGVTRVQAWTSGLLAAGKSSETPVAIIRRCSLPDQVVVHSTLGHTANELTPASKLRPPVIVVVGDVARLDADWSWFDQRPLFGQKIAVTRAAHQAEELRVLLEECGAEVYEQPAIAISEPADWRPVDEALGRLGDFHWIVFSSANGVTHFMQRLFDQGHDARALGNCKIAVIGPGTQEALARFHLNADIVPHEYRAEALAASLAPAAQGQRFLLVRASRGREVLSHELLKAGGDVQQIVVYESRDVTEPDARVGELLQAGELDWMTVTSSAIARSLANLFGPDLQRTKLVSISPITSGVLRELGYEPAAEARDFTMRGVVEAVVRAS
jgi:uroporphyrinogen III methyltransferase/synthase